MQNMEKALSELKDELVKAKYISKKPDGKGGFIYKYADDVKNKDKKPDENKENDKDENNTPKKVKMTAAVMDKETGEKTVITSEYESKEKFKFDLNRNGYQVIGRISVEGAKKTHRDELYDRGFKMR